jgi:hypothetical protein
LYYTCTGSGASATCSSNGVTPPLASQVSDPVAFFTGTDGVADNNGIIIEMSPLSGAAASVAGSIVFGIGTRANNALGGTAIQALASNGNFVTKYNGQLYSYSFVDSGSNGFYFLNTRATGIPTCTEQDITAFYCPSSTQQLSATTYAAGPTGAGRVVAFSVANSLTLFNLQNVYAYSDVGGIGVDDSSGTNSLYFDWGLPFFFGRNVYYAFENASVSGNQGPFIQFLP